MINTMNKKLYIDNQNTEIVNKILIELKKLKYNFGYKGTKYLIDTVYILYYSEIMYECNLEKNIYPIIAEKYNLSIDNIKVNISNATDKMCYDCDEEFLKNYLEDYVFIKPTPKKVACAILKKIKMN